jgi:hypothetical protein
VYLTKEQILAAEDLKHEDVEVSEWGGVVRIKTMTGAERDAYDQVSYPNVENNDPAFDWENFRARLLSFCLVDDSGERLFTGVDEVKALGRKSHAAIERCFKVAKRLNGIGAEVQEALKGN